MAQEKYRVDIMDVAQDEIDEAFTWYQSKGFDLGFDFLDELEVFLLKLKVNPFAYSYKRDTVREGILHRFPYQIVYEVVGNVVTVFHVFHAHRNPNTKF